ncbi:MAG TPA: electron transfer flavoprotein-ubiquinone oxidoreductase, partial [Oceanospirillales bacterium]|nr:electron transfer flavoprotein-ubiquinone oxidoreductase [Oceanospirillales bacterium]
VVIVGGGPSGLSAAIKLAQISQAEGKDWQIALVEKGSEIGAHIISGAVLEPSALNELFPNWQEMGAPVTTAVSDDEFYYLRSASKSIKTPGFLIPSPMKNHGNYIISLGNLCRWLGEQAENLGVNIFPGFPASEIIFDENDQVKGVITADMGVDAEGRQKGSFEPGYQLLAKHTIFSEGCRGHLGKQLQDKFGLNKEADPQHFGLGVKEIWQIDEEKSQPGKVVHTFGWPLNNHTEGGGFLYHMEKGKVALGFITALNYDNPYLSPFEEFQRWKHSHVIKAIINGGKRIAFGARAMNKGGFQSVGQVEVAGACLTGCEAGYLNPAKIKGIHTAMKTGMIAAQSIAQNLLTADHDDVSTNYTENVKNSWVHTELKATRNFEPALHKLGTALGSAYVFLDLNIFRGKLPFTLHNKEFDHECLKPAAESVKINYDKPDNKISFDRLSSVFLSSTNHEEDQPCHLLLKDASIPIDKNLPKWSEPAQRFCPAAVYEVIEENGSKKFRINAQNCVHCKTCDIKDPSQNITWVTPEGGGGPNYSNM